MAAGATYLHLFIVKVAHIIRQMRLEAPGNISTTSVFAAEKRVESPRTIDASSFRHVKHVAEDGNLQSQTQNAQGSDRKIRLGGRQRRAIRQLAFFLQLVISLRAGRAYSHRWASWDRDHCTWLIPEAKRSFRGTGAERERT